MAGLGAGTAQLGLGPLQSQALPFSQSAIPEQWSVPCFPIPFPYVLGIPVAQVTHLPRGRGHVEARSPCCLPDLRWGALLGCSPATLLALSPPLRQSSGMSPRVLCQSLPAGKSGREREEGAPRPARHLRARVAGASRRVRPQRRARRARCCWSGRSGESTIRVQLRGWRGEDGPGCACACSWCWRCISKAL